MSKLLHCICIPRLLLLLRRLGKERSMVHHFRRRPRFIGHVGHGHKQCNTKREIKWIYRLIWIGQAQHTGIFGAFLRCVLVFHCPLTRPWATCIKYGQDRPGDRLLGAFSRASFLTFFFPLPADSGHGSHDHDHHTLTYLTKRKYE